MVVDVESERQAAAQEGAGKKVEMGEESFARIEPDQRQKAAVIIDEFEHLDIERLLLSKELRTHAGDVFLDKYGQLINLNKSGQLAMRKLLEEHLNRVEWDDWKFPVRLYPYVSPEPTAEKAIVIDPAIAFGRPIVLRARVSTSAIVGRIDAGELVKDIADDYDLTEQEVENAVLYERRAA